MASHAAPWQQNPGVFRLPPFSIGGEEAMEQTDNKEIFQMFFNFMSNMMSLMSKKIDEGEIQSSDQFRQAVGGIFDTILDSASKNVDPNDKKAQTFLGAVRMFAPLILGNGGGNSKAQASGGKQLLANLIDKVLSKVRSRLGDGKEADTEFFRSSSTFPNPYFDEEAMEEAYSNLSDEAKEQIWGSIFRTVAGGLINHAINRATEG